MIPDLGEIFLLGTLSFSILLLSWKKGFFVLKKENQLTSLRWFDPLAVFLIYFIVNFLAILSLPWLFNKIGPSNPSIAISCWVTFLLSILILVSLLFYSFHRKEVTFKIWNFEQPNYRKDTYTGLICCALGFPLVLFIGELMDLLIYLVFHITKLPDQVAVLFLKMTFGYPFYFGMTIITVTILAPFIEETLFRGFLQSFLRQYLGIKTSIFITSLSFAFFHYAPEQGVANIAIIPSLFALALFLGFAYEKRKSLLAPIILHASFNSISVINLYFLEGIAKTGS